MDGSRRNGWGVCLALALWAAVVVGVAGDIGRSVFDLFPPAIEAALGERLAPHR